jgi:two-component system, NtrC family, response regulator AtoC
VLQQMVGIQNAGSFAMTPAFEPPAATHANSTQTHTSPAKLPPEKFIFGSTAAMALIHERMKKLAGANIPVLLTGESGTGKGLMAALIHSHSHAAKGALVQINCAALPAALMESELFGYERGAYTGASCSKRGRVELADSGTLFLDEIAELDPSLQAKLLHLLQDGQFTRLGGEVDREVNVRFIFATSRDLRQEIATGRFREDLFYRMDGVTLELPPLRERVEDIAGLAEYFIEKYNQKYNCRAEPLSDSTIDALQTYHWPGNIRQLENLMRRYVVLGSQGTVVSEISGDQTNVFQFVIPPNGKVSLKEITRKAVRQVERQVIFKVMEANGWKRKRSARMLKISYRALLYKLQELGVPSEQKCTSASHANDEPPAMLCSSTFAFLLCAIQFSCFSA